MPVRHGEMMAAQSHRAPSPAPAFEGTAGLPWRRNEKDQGQAIDFARFCN
jgi:hypothetical protein